LRKEPKSADEFLEWFFFYLLRTEKEKAKTALDKAMEADPENQITMCLAGEAYFRNGLYDEAIALFEKAVEINPSDIRLYNWLGICYRRLAKTAKAVERYQNALIIDPEDYNVHFNLGRAYTADRDFKNAKTEFAAALQYKPDLIEAKEALDGLPKVT
jgi:superkiller protein 3